QLRWVESVVTASVIGAPCTHHICLIPDIYNTGQLSGAATLETGTCATDPPSLNRINTPKSVRKAAAIPVTRLSSSRRNDFTIDCDKSAVRLKRGVCHETS